MLDADGYEPGADRGDETVEGGVSEMLGNLEAKKAADAPDCSNAWCDEPGTIDYEVTPWAKGFPVCPSCRDILEAGQPDDYRGGA